MKGNPPSSRGRSSAAPTPSSSTPKGRALWTSKGFVPESSVEIIGNVATLYGVHDDQLYIYGIDLADGSTKWSYPASTSGMTERQRIVITKIDEKVVFYDGTSPAQQDQAAMIAVDPSTGRKTAETEPRKWTSAPAECDAMPTSACATATVQTGSVGSVPIFNGTAVFSVGLNDGAVAQRNAETGFRQLSTDLVDPDLRDPDFLARRVGGRTVWQVRLDSIFGPGVSSDYGWDFASFDDQGVEVGSMLAHAYRTVINNSITYDLARGFLTSGIRQSNGGLAWRQDGTAIHCEDVVDTGGGPDLSLWCRYTGKVTFTYPASGLGRASITLSPDFSVALERYDPATGATRWSVPLGANQELMKFGESIPALDDEHVVIPTATGATVVDVRDGTMRTARD
ncbi:MAG: PQQ-binding-like beta-propeller repeat protein, partial [Actinobacteria bacterium]|nr:PQQ-binding-like beta-propeller repeat protein [Actinomycetota bacterium]